MRREVIAYEPVDQPYGYREYSVQQPSGWQDFRILEDATNMWNTAVMAGPTTVTKALTLLNLVANRPGLSLTEVSKQTAMPAATAHRLLRTLREHGLVRVDAAHRYHLGSHCAYLGGRFLEDVDLRAAAERHLQGLVEATGETAHLGVPDGAEVVYLAKVDSPQPVRMYSRIGARSPMYCTAMGKATLAFCDSAMVDRVVEKGLVRRTANTITDRTRLDVELRKTRTRGWAFDDIENEDGIRCIAAPVLVDEHQPVGAVSVSAPAERMSDQRLGEVAAAVVAAAQQVAAGLGYQQGAVQ
jgi:DNA-binding IclR family transcriptional regulator